MGIDFKKLKFFRHTHYQNGEHRKLSPAQEEVWENTPAGFVGHMLHSNHGMSIDELVAECIKYHYEHAEDCAGEHQGYDRGCSLAPTERTAAVSLVKLLEYDLAIVGHQVPRPAWSNRVLAYAVGAIDVTKTPAVLIGVGIFSEENPSTRVGKISQWTVSQEYAISEEDDYDAAWRRLDHRLRTDPFMAWVVPYLRKQ